MTFYSVNQEYALRALDATPGETIKVRVAHPRYPDRYSYADWERELVDSYIRNAVELAWDIEEPQGYHLQMLTAANRTYWAALNRPPTEGGDGSPVPSEGQEPAAPAPESESPQ